MELEHAVTSAALVHDICIVLDAMDDGGSEWPEQVAALANRIDELIEETPIRYLPIEWKLILAGLRVLRSQFICLMAAQSEQGDLVTEKARYDTLFGELCRLAASSSLKLTNDADAIRHSMVEGAQVNSDKLRTFLLSIPLPTLYWRSKDLQLPYTDSIEQHEPEKKPLVRVIAFLDQEPIVSPQLLKPNVLYPLVFHVHGLVWPKDAIRLRLDLLTTCPSTEYVVSEYHLDPPRLIENEEYEGELTGQIKFNSGQSSLLDDLVFKVQGAFETEGEKLEEVPVIGHNELRLRVVSGGNHPLMTGNRPLDRHISDLVTKLLKDCPSVKDELQDLLNMVMALNRLLATYSQEAIYKGRSDVQESEFQGAVLRDLRFILGPEVQEGPKQAGGVTDIRYRGVIVELKVERENGDRGYISKKYASQAVQYAGVEARQVSILLVLDLTSKEKPPGDIRNDIALVDVETHGGDDGTKAFPSKSFVFVVNGNMKIPSDYSR